MAQALARLVVDCSLVVKWKITTEDYAAEAEEILLDWQRQSTEACALNLLEAEVMSAFLRAHRKGWVSRTEAEGAILVSQSESVAPSVSGTTYDPRTRLLIEAPPAGALLRLAAPNAKEDESVTTIESGNVRKRVYAELDQQIGDPVVGASVPAAPHGEVIYRRAAGFADREVGRPVGEMG